MFKKNFDCGFLLIKSSFCSCPETVKFLNEIIDYGSQWQLLVLSPYYSIQCCLKVFVSICCFTANKALRHSQYQKNHNLHKCDHDLIQPSRIFQARIGTIHLERPQFVGRRGQITMLNLRPTKSLWCVFMDDRANVQQNLSLLYQAYLTT